MPKHIAIILGIRLPPTSVHMLNTVECISQTNVRVNVTLVLLGDYL